MQIHPHCFQNQFQRRRPQVFPRCLHRNRPPYGSLHGWKARGTASSRNRYASRSGNGCAGHPAQAFFNRLCHGFSRLLRRLELFTVVLYILPAAHQNQVYDAKSGLGVKVGHGAIQFTDNAEDGLNADIVQIFITVFYLTKLHIGQHDQQDALENMVLPVFLLLLELGDGEHFLPHCLA